jgi:hypothetical protein
MNSNRPSNAPSGARLGAAIAGAIVGFFAVGMLALSGLLLWTNSHKDHDGYISTKTERFSTATGAIATDNLDITDVPGWILDRGHVRLAVSPQTGKPVFVGIAPTKDVRAYLRGTAHATVTDVDYPSFHATYRTTRGGSIATPPSDKPIWAASAQGPGRQTLTWRVKDGNWSVVVMNADGSPGVAAGVKAGTRLTFLGAAAWSTLGGGILLLVTAGGLMYVGLREPRRRTDETETSEVPALA